MTSRIVLSQKTAVFTTEIGLVGHVVFDLWQKIWRLEDEGKLARKYDDDYVVYGDKSQDPENAQVKIYILILNSSGKE